MLFTKEKQAQTVANVLSVFQKMIDDLNTIEVNSDLSATDLQRQIEVLQIKQDAAKDEIARAKAARAKIQSIIE